MLELMNSPLPSPLVREYPSILSTCDPVTAFATMADALVASAAAGLDMLWTTTQQI